jgi:hypothetical protein
MLWTCGKNRRWRPAVAVAAALVVFVALIAGSAVRPHAAVAPPGPAAWSPTASAASMPTAQRHLGPPVQATRVVSARLSPRPSSLPPRPLHRMWMTRDLPTPFTRLPVQPTWPPVLASLNAFRPSAGRPGASAAGFADLSVTRLCVARC